MHCRQTGNTALLFYISLSSVTRRTHSTTRLRATNGNMHLVRPGSTRKDSIVDNNCCVFLLIRVNHGVDDCPRNNIPRIIVIIALHCSSASAFTGNAREGLKTTFLHNRRFSTNKH